jgi:hypothetical protein
VEAALGGKGGAGFEDFVAMGHEAAFGGHAGMAGVFEGGEAELLLSAGKGGELIEDNLDNGGAALEGDSEAGEIAAGGKRFQERRDAGQFRQRQVRGRAHHFSFLPYMVNWRL